MLSLEPHFICRHKNDPLAVCEFPKRMNLTMWGLCAILTVTEAISPDNGARTDKNIELLYKADWFRFPYPCE